MQIQAPFDPFRGSPSRAVASRQPSTEPQVTDAPLIAICEKWRIANTEHDEARTRRAIADTALCAARALGSADLDRIEIAAEQAEAASTAACLRERDLVEGA